MLQEITRRPRWLDLVFGITDGWWAFTDTALRPVHALLDVPSSVALASLSRAGQGSAGRGGWY